MKAKFLCIYRRWVTRPGADEFLKWLESTDFFTAPASTRFHLSRPGGLVEHSIHVYYRLRSLYVFERQLKEDFAFIDLSDQEEETIAICGLLHDICKANFYTVQMRNRKNAEGLWEQYPFYVVNDLFPYGHGEKSAHIVSSFMKLSTEESMAIRWHMGFSDNEFKAGGYSVGNAFGKFPLAVLAHIADLQATYLDEVEEGHTS